MDSDQDKQEENLQEETPPSDAPPRWSSGGPMDDLDGPETEEEDRQMLDEVDREILEGKWSRQRPPANVSGPGEDLSQLEHDKKSYRLRSPRKDSKGER